MKVFLINVFRDQYLTTIYERTVIGFESFNHSSTDYSSTDYKNFIIHFKSLIKNPYKYLKSDLEDFNERARKLIKEDILEAQVTIRIFKSNRIVFSEELILKRS